MYLDTFCIRSGVRSIIFEIKYQVWSVVPLKNKGLLLTFPTPNIDISKMFLAALLYLVQMLLHAVFLHF